MAERPGYLEPEALLRETRWLRRLAAGLVGAGDAEDLVQDTWLKTVEHPPRGPGLRPWLRRVATRASFRARARERWRRGWDRGAARDEALPSAAEAVERVALQREIVDAVLGLAEPYRSTMVLHYFEDLPAAEIARRENMPAATVRTRIHRALAHLRERLDAGAGGRASWIAILAPVAAKAAGISGAAAGGALAAGGVILMTKLTIAAAVVAVAAGFGGWFWFQDRSNPAVGRSAIIPVPGVISSPAGKTEVAEAGLAAGPAIAGAPFQDRGSGPPGASGPAVVLTGIVVDARNDLPIGGVRVAGLPWWPERVPSAGPETRSAADGHFRWSGTIREHELRGLGFTSDGFAHHEAGLHEIRRGSPPGSEDIGVIRLVRGVRVSGRVVDAATGEGVADAPLLRHPGYQPAVFNLPEARQLGRSGPDGRFTLDERFAPGPWAGEAALFAISQGGIGWTFVAAVEGREDVEGIELRIRPGANLSVMVVDAEDQPVEQAQVVALPRFPPLGPPTHSDPPSPAYGARYEGIGQRFWAETSADGRCRLTGLPIGVPDDLRFQGHPSNPRAYDLCASKPGFSGARQWAMLESGGTLEIRVKLAKAAGWILRGTVTAAGGPLIAGANVARRGRDTITTDPGGGYHLVQEQGQETEYLDVSAPGYAPQSRTVKREPGQEEVVADFVLEPALPIAGRVVDQEGKPVAGSTVVANLTVGRTFSRQKQIVTGEDGGFRIDDATAQPWEIHASPPEPREDWSSGPLRTVRGGDAGIEIVLRHHEPGRARVIADVMDVVTGEPADPVEARLTEVKRRFAGDLGFMMPAPALRKGGADFERVRPGSWSLSVRLSDGSRTTREFGIGDDDSVVRLRVPIGRPGAVEGRVVFERIPSHLVPRSVAMFTIPGHTGQWVLEKNGEAAPNATRGYARAAAKDGFRFRFEDVPPATPVRLYFTGKEIFGAADFVAGFDEEKSVEIQAVVAATLILRGTDAEDAAGIVVQTAREDGGWQDVPSSPSHDSAGWKCRVACAPGPVRWRAERHARGVLATTDPPAVTEGTIDLAPGAEREITATFPR